MIGAAGSGDRGIEGSGDRGIDGTAQVVSFRSNIGLNRFPDPPILRSSGPWAVLGEQKRGTRFLSLPVRSVLNSPATTGQDYWSVNPYVGCEFGCRYCYAHFAHRYVVERALGAGALSEAQLDDAFTRRIFVKAGAAEVLALTLKPARLGGRAVVIGTATDPYQPAERTWRITRQVLERLAQLHGLHIGIITKSPLVTRDIDLLWKIAERSRLAIHISLSSVDRRLVRRLETKSPVPSARLRALAQLTSAGLNAGVMVAPVLPGLTDSTAQLDALVRAARAAGTRFVRADPLRLYPAIRRRFLDVVAREFPRLLPRYESGFDSRGIVRADYAAALKERLARIRRKYGVRSGHEKDEREPGMSEWEKVEQREFF
jgi:DNA repair photolyase